MINIYYDFDTGINFNLYVSLDVGAVYTIWTYGVNCQWRYSDADMESNSKTAARAGTSYKIIENWFADVMARYI